MTLIYPIWMQRGFQITHKKILFLKKQIILARNIGSNMNHDRVYLWIKMAKKKFASTKILDLFPNYM